MNVQIAGLMTNLTQEYTNFLNFLTTAPSAFNVFKNDATLLNAQLNAVSACSSFPLACDAHDRQCTAHIHAEVLITHG